MNRNKRSETLIQGFVLILTLLLLFILTIFGFCFLLTAGNHYSATHSLVANENARMAAESASQYIVSKHNNDSSEPPFLLNSATWNGLQLQPLDWNDYQITGRLYAPWTQQGSNRLHLQASRGRHAAKLQLELKQHRLKDFAFFSDVPQILTTPSLIDGLVFARPSLTLETPGATFRDLVYAYVDPSDNALFHKKTWQKLDFPELSETIFPDQLKGSAIVIAASDPRFWSGERYLLNLDLLEIIAAKKARWQIRYAGTDLGAISIPHLWFDNNVEIVQSHTSQKLINDKPEIVLQITTSSSITIKSSIHPLESEISVHPLCLTAGGSVMISAEAPLAARIRAGIVSFGSLTIEGGGLPISSAEKNDLAQEVNLSAFLVEDIHRNRMLDAIYNNRKVVWFRGSVALGSVLRSPADLTELHFEASSHNCPLQPSFRTIRIVTGSRKWP